MLDYETVSFLSDIAVSGQKVEDAFLIVTGSGKTLRGKKLIFATGIKDIMPEIKGFADCWGVSVIHCPYCHGYEYRGKRTGIFANGERAFHLASMVNNLTDDLTLLPNGQAAFTQEQAATLKRRDIATVETSVAEIQHKDGILQNVVFSDGSSRRFEALYAALPFVQHSDIPASLGCEFTELGLMKVDGFQQTNIEGVFACGDNTNMMRSLAAAIYAGNVAGAVANSKLIEADF